MSTFDFKIGDVVCRWPYGKGQLIKITGIGEQNILGYFIEDTLSCNDEKEEYICRLRDIRPYTPAPLPDPVTGMYDIPVEQGGK